MIKQTVDFSITILDNGSTDNTAEIVQDIQKKYPSKTIKFLTVSKNQEPFANFRRAQDLAKAHYCILFHDDDILHPDYIKTALQVLKENPDIDVLSCGNITTSIPEKENWKKIKGRYFLLDKAGFGAYLTCYKSFTYPATIYKTTRLKQTQHDAKSYGKISDRPYLMDIVSENGRAIVLKDAYIKYRSHPGQDSHTPQSGPFEHEILNMLKKYKDESANFPLIKKLYSFFMYEKLWMFYRWVIKHQESFKDFEQKCLDFGILDEKIKSFSRRNLFYKLLKHFYQIKRDFCFKKYERKIK